MIRLPQLINAWQTPDFKRLLKQEIEQLDASLLPLQQGLTQSSFAKQDKFSVIIIDTSENPASLLVKAGVFYAGMIPGCSCADDPTPDSEYTEYCEIQLQIDKSTAETRITLL